MAGVVLKVAQAAGGSGGATQQVVQMADAASHIMDLFREEAKKNKEAARVADNEFNIRKNFLVNAVNAIKEATMSQYNIVICTDQEHDDFQALTGQILPMDLLNVEISAGKFVNFQVYVFETGRYLRRGRWELDSWAWWGESKKFTDIFMHVHFETAQKKLDADAIQKAMDQKKAEDKTAADAAAAAKATQDKAAALEAATLKAENEKKAADAAAQAGQQGAATTAEDGGAGAVPPTFSGVPPVSSEQYPSGSGGAPIAGQYAPGPAAAGAGPFPRGLPAPNSAESGPYAPSNPAYPNNYGQNAGMQQSSQDPQFRSTAGGAAAQGYYQAQAAPQSSNTPPAPSFTSHLARAAAGPAMQILMPSFGMGTGTGVKG